MDNFENLIFPTMVQEAESKEYGAARFVANGKQVVFRVAKTTPTKIGQFVTLWKRLTSNSPIAPLDSQDNIDFVIVKVVDGYFIFSREILILKGIMSLKGKGGKRALRVYPLCSKPIAKDAIKTQAWQLQYFRAFTELSSKPLLCAELKA